MVLTETRDWQAALLGRAFRGTALHMGEGEGNSGAPLMRQQGRRFHVWLNPGVQLPAADLARVRCSVPPAAAGGRGR